LTSPSRQNVKTLTRIKQCKKERFFFALEGTLTP
jgi:hypothetical protein